MANRVAAVLVLLVVGGALLLVVMFAVAVLGGRPLFGLMTRGGHFMLCSQMDEFEKLHARQLADEPDEARRERIRQSHESFKARCAGDPLAPRQPIRPAPSPSPTTT